MTDHRTPYELAAAELRSQKLDPMEAATIRNMKELACVGKIAEQYKRAA